MRTPVLLGLPRLIADCGLDSDVAIREVGCDPRLFSKPENTIDYAAVGRQLAHTVALTGRPYPGLELGGRLGLGSQGLLSKTVRLAPGIGKALHVLILHFHLHDRGAIPVLKESIGSAFFGYTVVCPEAPRTVHICDAALSITRNVLSELMGKGWTSTELHLLRDEPAPSIVGQVRKKRLSARCLPRPLTRSPGRCSGIPACRPLRSRLCWITRNPHRSTTPFEAGPEPTPWRGVQRTDWAETAQALRAKFAWPGRHTERRSVVNYQSPARGRS
jgi:hypothetical protein